MNILLYTSAGITGESLVIGLGALIVTAIFICKIPGNPEDNNYR